ncbi:hypothetical protein HYDPIDRAFT_38667 [Hydnomerulius pinastri MD-312]|nr:hypothetical protein HYDPIDRAFT_38667 [Hydnomerulius pinastri MD-312]
MDSFVSLAKSAYESYSESQSNVHKTGGQEYNSGDNGRQGSGVRFNKDEVLQNAGDADDDEQRMIKHAVDHVHNNPQQHHEDPESSGNFDQYKGLITSVISGASGSGGMDIMGLLSGNPSGGLQNQLMGMVVKKAGEQFLQGGLGGDNKQDAMNGAAMALTQVLSQNKLSMFRQGLSLLT